MKSLAQPHSEKTKPIKSNDFVRWAGQIATTSAGQKITIIRNGVNAALFVSASKYYDMTRPEFARIIGMSTPTLGRKLKSGGKLGAAETERLARVASINREAELVFGSAELAKRWLLTVQLPFGETPLSLLDTDAGAGEVRKMLSAIAYGGVA